jgi:DNA (cytosine-5)-methyltransferase 1
MNELALFAGAGGGILGGHLLGWRTVCAVEWNAYAAGVLVARQNDGLLPPFPIWDDVQSFDGRPWRGRVDVVSGGFPCQDISVAGKGAGIDGERSGMWRHMARIVREVGPRFVFVENSPALTFRGLDRVLGDLASMGYDAEWGVLGADDAGAPHKRERIWIVADSGRRWRPSDQLCAGRNKPGICGEKLADANGAHVGSNKRRLSVGWQKHEAWNDASRCGKGQKLADTDSKRQRGGRVAVVEDADDAYDSGACAGGSTARRNSWWGSEPDVGRVAHGVAARVDRLRAIGNGQVPAVAALAWQTLTRAR